MNVYEPISSASRNLTSGNAAASFVGVGAQLARLVYNALNKNKIIPIPQGEATPQGIGMNSLLASARSGLLNFTDGITVDTFLEETHTHKLSITQHPVEAGTVISDHAFMEPQEIKMTCIFYSSLLSEGLNIAMGESFDGGLWEGKLDRIYRQLREFQLNRYRLDIKTSKLNITNMILESIEVPVNAQNYNILEVHLTFKEIILVNTQTVNAPSAADTKNNDPTKNANKSTTLVG